MDACLGMKEATDLEANPEETESEAEHEEVTKEEAAVETWSTEGAVCGMASSRKVPRSAK
jgi:hypothetical protein